MTWTYDVQDPASASGPDDGIMTIVGPGGGELTQTMVNEALDAHRVANSNRLLVLIIGDLFETLSAFAISGTRLESIRFTAQSRVTSIGRKGLSNNVILTELVLPPSLLHVPKELCAGCEALPEILIPDSVLTTGYRAFYQCFALTNFILPKNVTTIVDNAFEDCLALQNANLSPINSVLTTVGDTVFKGCTNLHTIQFPNSLELLESGTFMNCTSLETMILNENVVQLGDSTFEGCTALQNVIFSTKLQSLGRATFRRCISLVQVLFPESTTVVGTDTFLETNSVLSLRMHRNIWDTVVATLPKGTL
jgi:hypothetical protein